MAEEKDNTTQQAIIGAGAIAGTDQDDTIIGAASDDTIEAGAGGDTVLAGAGDDSLSGGAGQDSLNAGAGVDQIEGGEDHDKMLGGSGSDAITDDAGNNLAAGDYVGEEWQLVDGKWVYNPELVALNPDLEGTPDGSMEFNDTIVTGDGDDVLLGNRGHDLLDAGAGDDTINAGSGADTAYGRAGDDLLNLEDGNDKGFGGLGADTVNAGAGDDLVYGDAGADNLLAFDGTGSKPLSMEQYAQEGWSVADGDVEAMSRQVDTNAGETYSLSFDLAANVAGGALSGAVEVLWNGEVVDTIQTSSALYETHTVEVTGSGDASSLTFRVVESEAAYTGPEIDMSGAIHSYDKTVQIGGADTDVAAFAPGQAKLYQVIDGQLKVFDPQTQEYQDAGAAPGYKINAIGFNVEDDLVYGIAKSNGVDSLGNAVTTRDLVMVDADGNTYRVGETPVADYVGDFDQEGNLWTFHTSMNRVSKIDVDNLDANGDPVVVNYDLPNDVFGGRVYDIAYSTSEGVFYAIEPPKTNGGNGQVHRVDMSTVDETGSPEITSVPISGTLFGDEMASGMAKGAFGAVFMDGDGNLYFGLNRGDHDLDGATDAQGAIYKVNVDFDAGTAYAEFMADAQTTGSNDGAVDPRSVDPFAPVDLDATVLIKDPTLISQAGGNDDLRGGIGDDTMFGEAGDDILHGGEGDDLLDGGAANDKVMGGTGNDTLIGGEGKDSLMGGSGDDHHDGGTGADYINAGSGADVLSGGAGADKLVGGTGSGTIEGGAGNDHMWGGNWSADGSSDTFIVAAGGGKDMIHDFEADHDQLDLSAYGLEFEDLEGLMQDQGWATVIDLSGLEGGQDGDKLILKSVSADDLDESNFIL